MLLYVKDLAEDRDRYKARCEALERAVKSHNHDDCGVICFTCINRKSGWDCCDRVDECAYDNHSLWQFDEERFAREAECDIRNEVG
jgi:hypothetical protein